jgi:hypothetical protein
MSFSRSPFIQPAHEFVTAAQLATTSYLAGSATDQLYVRANDGVLWSSWQPFMAGPAVTPSNAAIASGHSIAASSLFTASDPDGDTLTSADPSPRRILKLIMAIEMDNSDGFLSAAGLARQTRPHITIALRRRSGGAHQVFRIWMVV